MLQNLSAIEDVTVIGYAAGIYGEGSMAPIRAKGDHGHTSLVELSA